MPAAKNIDGGLYPDLMAAGGLGRALQSSLRDVGSSLTASELNFVVICALVESGSRVSQVYIDDEEACSVLISGLVGSCSQRLEPRT